MKNKRLRERLQTCRDKVVDRVLVERYSVDFLNEIHNTLSSEIRAALDTATRPVYYQADLYNDAASVENVPGQGS